MSLNTLMTTANPRKLDKTVFSVVLLTEDNWHEWRDVIRLELMYAGVDQWIYQPPPFSLLARKVIITDNTNAPTGSSESSSSSGPNTRSKAETGDNKGSTKGGNKAAESGSITSTTDGGMDVTVKREILLACRIINSSLHKSMFKYVNHVLDNPFEMWQSLQSHFELQNSATIQALKLELLSLRKTKGETVDAFGSRIDA